MANGITIPKTEVGAATGQSTKATPAAKRDVTSKDEFLQLLVHQLQNQDPLDPMKSEEFAVQLAQFSSLEQLVSINQKLDGGVGGSGGASIGTMASFLGQRVSLDGKEPVAMVGGSGPELAVDLPVGVRSARVDLLDADGKVVGSQVLENLTDGKQVIPLQGINVPNGSYQARVKAVDGIGRFVDVPSKQTGIVEGFLLEPTPALLIGGGRQIPMEKVVEVTQA